MNDDRLLDLLVSLYEGARDNSWQEASDLAELVSGDPWNDVDPIRFRDWLAEKLSAPTT